MSRRKLDKESAAKLEQQLPSIVDLKLATLGLQPDPISFAFPPGSTIPIAAVCLQDVACTLEEVRYALFEALAHLVWYREKTQPTNEPLAVFFGRFYADDAALRLYTAREHLTAAVAYMFEVRKQKLSVLVKGLERDSPGHPVAQAISRLLESDNWRNTIDYRNKWVHDKPPILEGTGIGYERRNRLIVTADSIGVSFGGGDEPRYSVDDLLAFIKPALFVFVETATALVSFYRELLRAKQQIIEL